jgi:hypothetical protein
VFDAGPLSRLYLVDIATRNVRDMFAAFAGAIHAPSMAHAEITSAWLQAVRDGHMSFDRYQECLAPSSPTQTTGRFAFGVTTI